MKFQVTLERGIVCISDIEEGKLDGSHLDLYAKELPELIRALQAKYDEYVERDN